MTTSIHDHTAQETKVNLRNILKPKILKKKGKPGPKTKLYNRLAPEAIQRHLEKNELDTLSNLTRGLKVKPYELQKARTSLHRARRIVIKKMIAYCYSDTEICMELNINGQQLGTYKTNLYKQEAVALKSKSPEETFIEYKHMQMEVVKELDVMINLFREAKTPSSLASALKTKSDILRDVATRAQDMGFMERKPKEIKMVGELDLSSISTEDLMKMNAKQIKIIDQLANGKVTSSKEIDRALNPKKLKLVVNNKF